MAAKAISRPKARQKMVEGIVHARACGMEIKRIEQEAEELRKRLNEAQQNQLQHLSRANLAADLLGFENLDEAFKDISDEEREATEASLIEQNSNGTP